MIAYRAQQCSFQAWRTNAVAVCCQKKFDHDPDEHLEHEPGELVEQQYASDRPLHTIFILFAMKRRNEDKLMQINLNQRIQFTQLCTFRIVSIFH